MSTDAVPVHMAFARQVRLRPDAVAIVSGDRRLTYSAVGARVARLADQLRQLRVGPDVLVGLFAERSPEAIIAMLAVLQAGGAYIPLDVNAPWARNAGILKECRPRLVLTVAGLRGRLTRCTLDILQLDSPELLAPGEPSARDVSVPDALAYVLYTSGTSGRPKGVMIAGRSLAGYIAAVAAEYGITPSDRVLQFAPLTFDNSAEEIFATLCRGATLVLRSTGVLETPSQFWCNCRRWGITVLDLPTAYWQTLAGALEPRTIVAPDTLRLVVVGGEKAAWDGLQQWRHACGPRVRLLNTYGPTEATIGVTVSDQTLPVTGEDQTRDVPIGHPLGQVQAYVVGRELKRVAPGAAGELVLGGRCLARGYLGQPRLTARSFRPDPFGVVPGGRLYLTGDRVRYRDDGELTFIGRLDEQVKIRGIRVEPAEVTATLERCPAVREAAVVARRGRAASTMTLTAYVVWDCRRPLDFEVTALRRWLGDRLPSAMLPADVVVLRALPRTPAGKLDRRALPAPDRGSMRSAPPRTKAERVVARAWRRLLGGSGFNRTTSFCDAGGDSLKLVHLQLELERCTGVTLAPADLARHHTIPEQAVLLEKAAESPDERAYVLADAVLGADIQPGAGARLADASGPVLLTGATGFIGSHVLAELLDRTSTKVVCLVRASDSDRARRVLEEQLRQSGLWRPALWSRVVPIPGDVARPKLGLGNRDFRMLSQSVRAVYHCAAAVNLLDSYADLRAANVHGTNEIIRFASVATIPLNLVSTLDVLDTIDHSVAGAAAEAPVSSSCAGLDSGYALSKWVAERLARQAAERGLPVTVYRLGWVTGHSMTGVAKLTDLPARLMQGVVALGAVPRAGFELRPVPVDFASRAIVALSLSPQSVGRFFHLTNPRAATGEQLAEWAAELGYPLVMVSTGRWWRLLSARVAAADGTAIAALSFLLKNGNVGDRVQYRLAKTLRALLRLRIGCPPPDRRLLSVYVEFFASRGFLKPSPAVTSGRSPNALHAQSETAQESA